MFNWIRAAATEEFFDRPLLLQWHAPDFYRVFSPTSARIRPCV